MTEINLGLSHVSSACGTLSSLQVKFTEKVHWMSLEFDPRTGFAQREDKLGELLIPRKKSFTPLSLGKQTTPPSPFLVVGHDDLHAEWDRYTLEYPPGLVLLPGEWIPSAALVFVLQLKIRYKFVL